MDVGLFAQRPGICYWITPIATEPFLSKADTNWTLAALVFVQINQAYYFRHYLRVESLGYNRIGVIQ